MKRRDLIRIGITSAPLLLAGCSIWPHLCASCFPTEKSDTLVPVENADGQEDLADNSKTPRQLSDEILKDQRAKSAYFAQNFPDDIYFRGEKFQQLQKLTLKFRQAQKAVGFGNFNLLGMDDFFHLAATNASVGAITTEEKKFLEELFYFDASRYGFNGAKVLKNFSDHLRKNEAQKIAGSGHFLKKGESINIYQRVRKDIGPSLVLTSGMRGIAKQFHLFMEKGLATGGNMSKASRSLAPPGYSFHGRGDFDVGKVGFGLKNFTDDFADTDEYKRLLDLGYINIRYTQNNLLGVRFEPWHIKVET